MNSIKPKIAVLLLPLWLLSLSLATNALAGPGAIFTTEGTCSGTNINIFTAKGDVYLDGGPNHPGSAGLPPGTYYIQVTEPNGTLLGSSVVPVAVVNALGEFASCYQLSAILFTASSGLTVVGYDTTSNAGGEYKVWASLDPLFANSASKTDNFKVKDPGDAPPPPPATICVEKFYDANANGQKDPGEQDITGWKVSITDDINLIRFTPICNIVDPDTYTVTEFNPTEMNWIHTGAWIHPEIGVDMMSACKQQVDNITLVSNEKKTVRFGNVCLGQAGGLTLGYWSNKNGQAYTFPADITLLNTLNLRNANGTHFAATKAGLPKWLLGATATNMAYMLSAQLTAMELNTQHSLLTGVSSSTIIYRPELISCGITTTGFISIGNLMAAANSILADPNGNVLANHPARPCQEKIKTALDDANNNKPFYVQPGPCAFTFSDQ